MLCPQAIGGHGSPCLYKTKLLLAIAISFNLLINLVFLTENLKLKTENGITTARQGQRL